MTSIKGLDKANQRRLKLVTTFIKSLLEVTFFIAFFILYFVLAEYSIFITQITADSKNNTTPIEKAISYPCHRKFNQIMVQIRLGMIIAVSVFNDFFSHWKFHLLAILVKSNSLLLYQIQYIQLKKPIQTANNK